MNVGTVTSIASNQLLELLPGTFYRLMIHEAVTPTFFSRQCEQLFGYSSQELQALRDEYPGRVIHSRDRAKVLSAYLAAGHLATHHLRYRIVASDNHVRHVSDQFICRRKNGSRIIEGYVVEIDHRNLRAKFVRQLRAYRDAIDVNIISSITDTKGNIIYANRNFCLVSKYSAQELVGQNHRIVRSGFHSTEFFAELWRTISSGKVWQGEIRNRAKDGTLYWVETVIIPIFNAEEKIESYLSLRLLITDKKEAELQRSDYTRMLEKIAFMVAHRIRGPLCSVLGLISILQMADTNEEYRAKALAHLKEAACKLDEFTRELSRFVFDNEIELRAKEFLDRIRNEDHKY